MKGLWQYIPPPSPDTSGFATVMYGTDGIGIIDDVRGCGGNHYTCEESRAGLTRRVFSSEISNEDIVLGTKDKILARFKRAAAKIHPNFAVISGSPISSLIGTDLGDVARTISREGGIPASYVELNGHNTYAEGIDRTLVCLAGLFTRPCVGEKHGVNIIGANHIDWSDAQVSDLSAWIQENGFTAVSNWGPQETAVNFMRADEAEVNLVVTSSGIRLAQWLKKRYGTPYIAGTPFGKHWSDRLSDALRHCRRPACPEPGQTGVKILLIGEQFCCNALRNTLIMDFGFRNVCVASFFPMEKALMSENDIRLKSENELKELFDSTKYGVVFGDPFMRYYTPTGCKWIDFPHRAISAKLYMDHISLLTGENADRWLDTVL